MPPVIDRTQDADAALLLRLGSSQPGDALERLYDRFSSPVYRLALGALRDPQLSEEVVLDTGPDLDRSA